MKGWAWFAVIQIIAAVAMVVGWVLLIPFSILRLWRTVNGITVWYLIDRIYGNAEDGVTGPSWYNPRTDIWRTYLWSAWRNSANNLRWIFAWKGGPFWRREWHGWYAQAGFRVDTGWPVLSAGRI